MKTYFVYWRPGEEMRTKVEAETPEDAYKAAAGDFSVFDKTRILSQEVIDTHEITYEVYEDSEDNDSITLKGTFKAD